MLKKLLCVFVVLGVMVSSPLMASAKYPDRPISIIVPFGAGGEADTVARLLADSMGKVIGQNIVVQNVVGAAGVTGISAVLNSKPDGYTLGVPPSAPLVMHPHMRQVPYTLDQFAFVGRILKAPYLVLVAKNSPWNTLEDMIEDMKANPNKYFFASAGVGSVPYFAALDLFSKAGVQVKHVPCNNDADAFQAMAGNRVQMYTTTAGALAQFDVKGLALMDSKRDDKLPDLPTLGEKNIEAYFSQWFVLMAPKGIPAEVMNTLRDAMAKTAASPEFIEKLAKLNFVPGYLNSEDCEAFVLEESKRNEVVIKAFKEAQK